ncbi:MAG: substrate-binding domain-containing protein [Pyrinomonadaceae bacterium]
MQSALTGYRQALADAGVRFQSELVVQGDGKAEGGMEAMSKLLSLAKPPTAVFCYNDMSAIGAMRVAFDRGLSVPEDISIVGFDDLSIASFTRPLLTTIRQPKLQMGRLAMETLLQLLSGARVQNSVKLKGELIVRKSTAPPKSLVIRGVTPNPNRR